jgi:hypothetical protein
LVWISSTISFKPLFMGLRKFFLLKYCIFYATRGYKKVYRYEPCWSPPMTSVSGHLTGTAGRVFEGRGSLVEV